MAIEAADGLGAASETRKIKESDRAYEAVKHLIVSLQLPPGAVIEEARLRQQVAVGRTPLREALYRLADLGLVIVAPHRGFFVSELSATDLQQLTELRLVLEGTAARLAAERAVPSLAPALRSALRQTEPAIDTHDLSTLISIDLTFHGLIARASGNRYLEDALHRHYTMMLRFWYLSFDRAGHLPDVMREHHNIVGAIEQRDSVSAEAAMRFHVIEFRNKVRALL
jgi:DNA-binding GntR family transcriptional regulator